MCYMWACRCALGLQMQVKGKEVKDDTVQQKELAVYFSHGNLQKFHLRLALLNTMGVCYKGGSFSTAANFAWWLLKSEPLQTIQQGYNKFCRHARGSCRMPKNWIITFNSESLLLVVQQLLHLYPMVSQKDVSCPYCTACFVPVRRGNLCPICELAIVGFNASGCWMCIFISRNVITHAYFHISTALSTFENHVERYGRTVTYKSWTNLRVFLRDWRRLFSDHWNDSRSKNFHVFSLFTIWNLSLCFCFPFSVSDKEKCQ